MRTLLQNGIGLAVFGLLLSYFGIYAPIKQMAQGKAGVITGVILPIIGPFFCVGGLSLILATLVSRARAADFSQNQFQTSPLHRTIVIVGMLAGLALGLYLGIFVMQQKLAEFGYVPGTRS